MSRLATSFVLGYHGCNAATAKNIVLRNANILQSKKSYDWLGPGAYFWEADPVRALEWANWKVAQGAYKEAAVIGAVIDLGNCLDLTSRKDLDLVKGAYFSLLVANEEAGMDIPINKNPKTSSLSHGNNDRLLRYLDCAVITHLHNNISSFEGKVSGFDTVRGMFEEGSDLYPGCGYKEKNHVQIAVRNPAKILGVFLA